MEVMPKFVDMAKDAEEMKEDPSPEAMPQPVYPYGLCLCLSQDELDKLDLDTGCEPGDMLHMHCMAKVTSVSKNDTTDGPKMRVELQITAIACESEDGENEEAETRMRPKVKSPYK